MSDITRIMLAPSFFGSAETTLVKADELRATLWRYGSGVAAVRLENGAGSVVVLPFHGQQIWSAHFGGRDLAMRSMFTEPVNTRDYLSNYGAFLLHCGVTATGVPDVNDHHPLHGELPNAPYQRAWLEVGEDECGPFISLGGEYEHILAFNHHYRATPRVTLHASQSVMDVTFSVTNLKRTPMERMYLAHINFRPVDYGRLVYSAPSTPEHARVRHSIPSHVQVKPGYREFLDELQANPSLHHVLKPELVFDPEAVLSLDYLADKDGWAHTMQVHPDGSADYVAHQPAVLDKPVRWICRTPDQDAIGIILPATAEPEGYTAEKAKGNVKELGAGETWCCHMRVGVLSVAEALAMEDTIGGILAAGA